jgi:hypothetical protein
MTTFVSASFFNCSNSPAGQQSIIHSGQISPLDGAEEGTLVFLEPGFYYREEGFTIHRGCTLVGASSRSVTTEVGLPIEVPIFRKYRTKKTTKISDEIYQSG